MIDILAIRDRLNELPFVDGTRRVLVGRISESRAVAWTRADGTLDEAVSRPTAEIADADELIKKLASELERRGLALARGGSDGNSLYAVQMLRRDTRLDFGWMRDAVHWVARITTVAIGMVVPILAGRWLDRQLSTQFLSFLGVAVGVTYGVWQLWQLVRRSGSTE